MNPKIILIAIATCLALIVIANVVLILAGGKNVPTPTINRDTTKIGSGEDLRLLVIGDSTAIAQGADYSDGYVVQIASRLSKKYSVEYKNNAVSGATIVEVANNQLDNLGEFIPDVVLIAAGANDVTHLTRLQTIEKSIQQIINTMQAVNPDVKLVFTGAAAMDAVKRFPQPTRWLVGVRTHQINNVFRETLVHDNTYFVDVAQKTRDTFADRPDLLAEDNFHPNAAGYAEWTKVLFPVVQDALNSQ